MSERMERMRADHLAVLTDALGGVELTQPQARIVRWLAGWDAPTVETVAEVLRKARGAAGTGCKPGRERALIATMRKHVNQLTAERDQLVRTRTHLEALVEDRCARLDAVERNQAWLQAELDRREGPS